MAFLQTMINGSPFLLKQYSETTHSTSAREKWFFVIHWFALHYTSHHRTALPCTAHHHTAHHRTPPHTTAPHCTAVHFTALHFITLHRFTTLEEYWAMLRMVENIKTSVRLMRLLWYTYRFNGSDESFWTKDFVCLESETNHQPLLPLVVCRSWSSVATSPPSHSTDPGPSCPRPIAEPAPSSFDPASEDSCLSLGTVSVPLPIRSPAPGPSVPTFAASSSLLSKQMLPLHPGDLEVPSPALPTPAEVSRSGLRDPADWRNSSAIRDASNRAFFVCSSATFNSFDWSSRSPY